MDYEDIVGIADVKRVRVRSREAESTIDRLREWLWKSTVAHDVLPRKLSDDLEAILTQLAEQLWDVRLGAEEACARLQGLPLERMLSGLRLTREEYHLLSAQELFSEGTSKALGLSPYDDFEAFSMLCYEDERRIAYINPEEKPLKPGVVRVRSGISPEEVHTKALRPEQKEFFERYLPDVYRRFKP